MRRIFAAAAAALLLTGVGLAVTRDAGALPPIGTTSTETVGGFSFSFTYNGPEWIVINDTSSAGAGFKRPNVSALVMSQLGSNAALPTSQCNVANAIEAMQAKYDLAPLGYFVGHSSGASVVTKSIRPDFPLSNQGCADRLVSHLKGVGLSGVAWRVGTTTPTTKYSSGGVPYGPDPWPRNITHVWWFTGVLHDPVNRQVMGGADENTAGIQTMSMSITEAWHWTAQQWDDPINLPTPIIPTTITAPVIFDHVGTSVAGVPNHQRVVVTPGEGHVLQSSAIDSDADYWQTMLTPADQPSATTTPTTGPTTTSAPSTSSSTTTTQVIPSTTTTSAPASTSPSTTTVPPTTTTTVDPVRQAIVDARDAAQHALDVYDQEHA